VLILQPALFIKGLQSCRRGGMSPDEVKAEVEEKRKIKHRETEEKTVAIRGRKFTLLTPKFIEEYIDIENPLDGFPLWAKAWEASWSWPIFSEACPRTRKAFSRDRLRPRPCRGGGCIVWSQGRHDGAQS